MQVLITGYVVGEKYSNYIPIFLYTVNRIYPQYDLRIYVDKGLPENVKQAVNLIGQNGAILIDAESKRKLGDEHRLIQASRWLSFNAEDFEGYEFIKAFHDIDFFAVKQDPDSIGLHLQNCERTGMPYDNKKRGDTRPFSLQGLGHFFKVQPYFEKVGDTIKMFREKIAAGDFSVFHHPQSPIDIQHDEELLYNLIEQSGLPIFTHRIEGLGIHLGLARRLDEYAEHIKSYPSAFKQQFIDTMENDNVFKEMLGLLTDDIQQQMAGVYKLFKENGNEGELADRQPGLGV
jgi:hypothetical protein